MLVLYDDKKQANNAFYTVRSATSGALLAGPVALTQLMGSTSINFGDPRIVFDSVAQRFFLVTCVGYFFFVGTQMASERRVKSDRVGHDHKCEDVVSSNIPHMKTLGTASAASPAGHMWRLQRAPIHDQGGTSIDSVTASQVGPDAADHHHALVRVGEGLGQGHGDARQRRFSSPPFLISYT